MNQRPPPTEQVEDQPIYWFTLLELAVACGNHAGAAEAQRQLARLGVRVSYGRPAARQRGGVNVRA